MQITPSTYTLKRVRDTLDGLNDNDISIGMFKVMEAMYAWMETITAQEMSTGDMVPVTMEELIKSIGVKKPKGTTTKEDVDAKTKRPRGDYL